MPINVPVFMKNTILAAPIGGVCVVAASVIVGSSSTNELTVNATGIDAGSGIYQSPGYVFLQARQRQDEPEYPDEFALQVIQVWTDSVTFQVKRLDSTGGWGQSLQVDILFLPFSVPG